MTAVEHHVKREGRGLAPHGRAPIPTPDECRRRPVTEIEVRFGRASTPGVFGQVGQKVEADAVRRGPWLILDRSWTITDPSTCRPASRLSVRLVRRQPDRRFGRPTRYRSTFGTQGLLLGFHDNSRECLWTRRSE
ncbi:hypothetical protein GCM10010472_69610 [Pseudonocardia halophobica]|uniref:Uncharacterized protein n=1 Tax=Pseudonocardia halophobica TaxID=29401 RepID=A0A9W6L3Q2_9PSEU|nr:hypothetical protein [Pseudonocardia halophobica]GLL12382.1 hypothetical protein GCM10017577_35230 [Pseudonocardia halophobica]